MLQFTRYSSTVHKSRINNMYLQEDTTDYLNSRRCFSKFRMNFSIKVPPASRGCSTSRSGLPSPFDSISFGPRTFYIPPGSTFSITSPKISISAVRPKFQTVFFPFFPRHAISAKITSGVRATCGGLANLNWYCHRTSSESRSSAEALPANGRVMNNFRE